MTEKGSALALARAQVAAVRDDPRGRLGFRFNELGIARAKLYGWCGNREQLLRTSSGRSHGDRRLHPALTSQRRYRNACLLKVPDGTLLEPGSAPGDCGTAPGHSRCRLGAAPEAALRAPREGQVPRQTHGVLPDRAADRARRRTVG